MRPAPLAAAAALAAALAAAPASAQLKSLSDAASEAVSALKGAAKETLLVGDLLGAEVLGPSGDVVGTVDNLVALPGGTLVAVIVDPKGSGSRFPIPFKAAKLSAKAAGKQRITLPDTVAKLRGSQPVARLQQALGTVGGGGN